MVCVGNISSVRSYGLSMTPPCSRWNGFDSLRLVERSMTGRQHLTLQESAGEILHTVKNVCSR